MRKTLYFSIFILLFIAAGCSNPEKDNSNLQLEGTISNAPQQEMYLNMFTNSGYDAIDTIQLNETGEFEASTNIDKWGFYQLGFDQSNAVNLILLPGDKLQIEGDGEKLVTSSTVRGSKETSAYANLIQQQIAVRNSMDSLNAVKQQLSQNRDMNGFAQVLQAEKSIVGDYHNQMKLFIDNNPNSRATLVAVEQLDMKEDMAYFEKVVANLSEIIPESDYYTGLQNRVNAARATTVGASAPDITLPNPEGKEFSLSDLKGNYVLLDFWAAWCRPCRAENPNVVEMYQKYKDQGFTVFSVSLDGVPAQKGKGKELWVDAIEKDGLTWPYHVSDLQGWTSSAAQKYSVNSIPFSLLINPEGEIIAKNLRGQQLRSKLSTIFK